MPMPAIGDKCWVFKELSRRGVGYITDWIEYEVISENRASFVIRSLDHDDILCTYSINKKALNETRSNRERTGRKVVWTSAEVDLERWARKVRKEIIRRVESLSARDLACLHGFMLSEDFQSVDKYLQYAKLGEHQLRVSNHEKQEAKT